MLNMFRTLIHASSGACDFSIVSPHWLCVLVSMCVGVSVWLVGVVSVLQAQACNTDATQTQPHQIFNTQRTENRTTIVVIQQHSRKLLVMDILISETCWVHKKWNKITSDIKLVFYSSNITMMYGPINIRTTLKFVTALLKHPVYVRKRVDANWSTKLLDVIWMVFRKYFCLLWAKLSWITGFTTLKKITRTIFVALAATASDP